MTTFVVTGKVETSGPPRAVLVGKVVNKNGGGGGGGGGGAERTQVCPVSVWVCGLADCLT